MTAALGWGMFFYGMTAVFIGAVIAYYIINKVSKNKKKHKGGGYRISNSLRLSMEITMTDRSVLAWVHSILGVGTLNKKPRKGLRKDGTKFLMQYKWRCTFRDALYVCILLFPYAHTKLEKIQQIIDHYTKGKHRVMNNKVVNLKEYKELMSLE